jgi:predicted metal-binding protein
MEDPHLNNDQHLLQEIVRAGYEKFPAGQEVYWESKDALKKAVQDELATRFGFTIAENGNSFLCGRGKNPKHSTPAYKELKLANAEEHSTNGKKTRTVSSMRCGCTFRIQYTNTSAKMALAPPEAVRITKASFLHTNGCQPSVAQIQVMRKRNGHFTVQVSKQKMWDVIQLLNGGNHVPSHLL